MVAARSTDWTEPSFSGASSIPDRQPSQALTLSGFASIHFLAAAAGSILSTAMYFATVFWSSLLHWNFLTKATPASSVFAAHLVEKIFSGTGSG